MPKLQNNSGIGHILLLLFIAIVTIGFAVYYWGGLDSNKLKDELTNMASDTVENKTENTETNSQLQDEEEQKADTFKEGFIEGCVSGDPENAKILEEAGIDVPMYCNCVYDGLAQDYSKSEILKMSLEVANGKRDDSFLYEYAEVCLLDSVEE